MKSRKEESGAPRRPRALDDRRRSEAGDTLIEVLLAIVVLGLASVAVLLAFGTSISGSAEHRNLATMDTVLRTAAEETIAQIQQQSNAQFGTCPVPDAVTPSLPSGWTMQMAPTVNGSSYPTEYWDTALSPPQFSANGCVTSTTASPQVNSPQLVTITVMSPAGVVSSPLSFVVDDPLARPTPVAGPATKLVFLTSPGNTTAGTNFATQPIVAVEDANNNYVTSDFSAVTLTVTSNTGTAGASLSNTCQGSEVNGVVTFSGCSISTAGNGYTITATDPEINPSTNLALTPATSGAFNITDGLATQLAFSPATPGPGTAGSAIPSVAVQVQDAYGNLISTATGSVTMSIQTGSPQSTFTSGTTTVSLVGGVATFSTLVVDTSGSYTLTATPVNVTGGSGTITAGSASVSVVAGPAHAFTVANPGNQTAGSSFNDTISAVDAYNNVATSYNYSGSLTYSGPSNSPSGVSPSYPSPVTFTSGVATLSGIDLVDAQNTTLTVAQGAISGTSPSFAVGFGPASSFTVANPGTRVAGTAFNDTLTATDAYGNTVTSYGGQKTVSFSGPSSSPGGTAPSYPTSATSVTFNAGVGTASGITLFDSQNTALTASQTTGTVTVTGTSSAFTVNPAGASKLAFNPTTPGPGSVATAIPNVAVQVDDTYGNLVTTASGSVTLTINSGSTQTSFAPGATTAVTLSSGVATFSNLLINTAGTYTFTATPGSISGVTAAVSSSSFTVAKVTPTDVVANSTPTTLGSGVTFTATVSGPSGGTTPTGTVSWSVSGTAGVTGCGTSTTTLSAAGTATCTITVSSAGTYIVTDSYSGDTNYLATTSAANTVSVGFAPNLLQIESKSTGTAGEIQSGDLIGVTFPVTISPGSVCPGQTASSFNVAGTVTVTSNTAPTTGNDELTFTPTTGQCTGNVTGFASGGTGTHAGYIDLGSKSFVTSTESFGSSTLRFDGTTNNIQLTLGGTVGVQGTFTTATGTYFPDSAIQSSTGVAVSGSASAANIFTVTQPTAASIASATSSPNGTPSSGDQIVYGYSEQIDPDSIQPGWNGSATNVEACFTRASNASTVLTIELAGGCSTADNLGTVNLGDGGHSVYYISSGTTATFTATMSVATVSGASVVTVTLNATTSTFTTDSYATQWTWTPSSSATDLAGNPVSTSVSPVSTSKENFAPEQPALNSLAEFREVPSFFRLLEQLEQIVWVV